MKKSISLLILLFFAFISKANDITGQSWFLLDVQINGETFETPKNVELPYLQIYFFNASFISEFCEYSFMGQVDYESDTSLYISEFDFVANTCSALENENFRVLYTSLFTNHPNSSFSYSISLIDEVNYLTIVNEDGDIAHYADNVFTAPPPELTNSEWFLHELIEGNDSISVPSYAPYFNIPIEFDDTDNGISNFTTYVCHWYVGQTDFNTEMGFFNVYFDAINLSTCYGDNAEESELFTEKYIDYFYSLNSPGPFYYTVTTEGTSSVLIVTNPVGNQAVYRNTLVGVDEIDVYNFFISPNPVKNKLYVNHNNGAIINSISLYALDGRLIIKELHANEINISNLNDGIYFININYGNNKTTTRRVIKAN